MSAWDASIVKELDTYLFTLGAQEAAVLGSLAIALVAACTAFVLLRRQRHETTPQAEVGGVKPSDVAPQKVDGVAAAQAELRELVREFSALAAQVLRTVDRHQAPPRLPEAGGAALQLLDLGLSPADAARATGMSMGEVALLMNLRKVQASTLRLPAMSSIGGEESTDESIGGHGAGTGRPVWGNEDGRQVG